MLGGVKKIDTGLLGVLGNLKRSELADKTRCDYKEALGICKRQLLDVVRGIRIFSLSHDLGRGLHKRPAVGSLYFWLGVNAMTS